MLTTGAPPGAGFLPAKFLQPGDVVRVEIENIGLIEIRLIAEPDDTAII